MAGNQGKAAPTRRGNRGALGALLLLPVLVGIWGYGQMTARQALDLRAENAYRRAFHGLIARVEGLESRLDTLMVANTEAMLLKSLEEVRLQATSASEDLNLLPLGAVPLNQVKRFISQIGELSRSLSLKVQGGQVLSADDRAAIFNLRDQSRYFATQLNELRGLQQSGRLRWVDQDRFLDASYDGEVKSPLLDPLVHLDKYFAQGVAKAGAAAPKPGEPPAGLAGAEISAADAVQVARRFLGDRLAGDPKVVSETKGELPSHRLDAPLKNGLTAHLDVTRRGGHVAWMLADRPVTGKTLQPTDDIRIAREFATSRGYSDMALESFTEYDAKDVGVVSLVPRQDGVLLYPDLVRVRIAQDNGEVIGFNAQSYLRYHRTRELPSPRLTAAEARARVVPNLTVSGVTPALIRVEAGKEILTYEIRGSIAGREYRIYTNAVTGDEERIERAGAS